MVIGLFLLCFLQGGFDVLCVILEGGSTARFRAIWYLTCQPETRYLASRHYELGKHAVQTWEQASALVLGNMVASF